MATPVLKVKVVSADRMVWEGEAESLITRTIEGDIGVLPGHEPLLAALVPGTAVVIAADGNRETFMVDGGFISVEDNICSLISQFARMGAEIDVHQAELEFAEAKLKLDEGDTSPENMAHYQRAKAQLRAADHAGTR